MGEVENESNADFLGMAIFVISLAGRANKAASSESFYALIWRNVPFCSPALESGDCGDSQADRRGAKSVDWGSLHERHRSIPPAASII